jgi:tetratricopeptide (TPR) repeat protein
MKRLLPYTLTILSFLTFISYLTSSPLSAQSASVREYNRTFLTYPFGDPNPVARTGKVYPYFRFDGFATQGINRDWKIVELENDWIKVLIAPEMGGKILGAIEKSTGQEFIYLNKVVKFRDISMRGAWTSGGIEFNFGSIGHAPTTASPVDYLTRTNSDGSVSCFIGAMDLTSRSEWRVEIRLPADKAWVETNMFWYNPMDLTTSKYHWATAAADAAPDLTYYFPGDHYIGHAGEESPWPVLADGRNISNYAENNYGSDHSYHVLGSYTDFFAGMYASRNFGFGHWNDYTEKVGKKIWIWSLSPQGALWTDLLTDQPGNMQYTEIQTGLLFNQEAAGSTFTPFKHLEFPGNSCERFSEHWFPILGTGGVTEIGKAGILYVNDGKKPAGSPEKMGEVKFCALEFVNDTLILKSNSGEEVRVPIKLKPLELFTYASPAGQQPISVSLANGRLNWSVDEQDARNSDRPVVSPPFDWNSVQGLYLKALEFSRQREYSQSRDFYRQCLVKDPHYLPALSGLAEEYIRILKPKLAEELLDLALSYDTYDPKANYLLGIVKKGEGSKKAEEVKKGEGVKRIKELYEAKEAFGLAAKSMEYRSASYTGLAEIALMEKNLDGAFKYSRLAQDYNRYDIKAIQLEIIACRLAGKPTQASELIKNLTSIDPLNHFAAFEQYLGQPSQENLAAFKTLIRNEFPEQTYLELAIFYHNLDLIKEAIVLLNQAPDQVEVQYWRNYLQAESQQSSLTVTNPVPSLDLITSSPSKLIFPYRPETLRVLEWAESVKPSWKNRYYIGLIRLSVDDSMKAKELFKSCRYEPSESHFYLTRAKLFEGMEEELVLRDLNKAVELQPDDWRCWNALGNYFARNRGWSQYLEVTRKANSKIPGHMILQFDLAKAELYNHNYDQACDILNQLILLPAEGAREGHEIYRSALVLRAVDYFRHQRYAKALTDLEEARKWPVTLGVGKPYVTDERVEDYMTGLCYLQMNQVVEATKYFRKVIDYTNNQKPAWDTPYLLAAQSYKLLSQEEEGDHVLTGWMKTQPANPLMMWAVATYTNNEAASSKALERIGWKPEESPWGLGDAQLALVYEIMKKVTLK